MSIQPVLTYPDPELRSLADPVTVFDDDLRRLSQDLLETLYANAPSIGLAAPQLGARRQVLAMDLSGSCSAPEVYVNPEILARSHFGFCEERCLSVPDVVVNVWRATRVRVRAWDPDGEAFERELEGLHAVCLQHEMDHFAGKLLPDHMFRIRRFFFERRHRSAGVPVGA